MADEPKWLANLDVARHRILIGTDLAIAWATFAIKNLPEEMREKAAAAFVDGKFPQEVFK